MSMHCSILKSWNSEVSISGSGGVLSEVSTTTASDGVVSVVSSGTLVGISASVITGSVRAVSGVSKMFGAESSAVVAGVVLCSMSSTDGAEMRFPDIGDSEAGLTRDLAVMAAMAASIFERGSVAAGGMIETSGVTGSTSEEKGRTIEAGSSYTSVEGMAPGEIVGKSDGLVITSEGTGTSDIMGITSEGTGRSFEGW